VASAPPPDASWARLRFPPKFTSSGKGLASVGAMSHGWVRMTADGERRIETNPTNLRRALAGMCHTNDQPGQGCVLQMVDVFLDGLCQLSGSGLSPDGLPTGGPPSHGAREGGATNSSTEPVAPTYPPLRSTSSKGFRKAWGVRPLTSLPHVEKSRSIRALHRSCRPAMDPRQRSTDDPGTRQATQ
jgi:hypothetical protein